MRTRALETSRLIRPRLTYVHALIADHAAGNDTDRGAVFSSILRRQLPYPIELTATPTRISLIHLYHNISKKPTHATRIETEKAKTNFFKAKERRGAVLVFCSIFPKTCSEKEKARERESRRFHAPFRAGVHRGQSPQREMKRANCAKEIRIIKRKK